MIIYNLYYEQSAMVYYSDTPFLARGEAEQVGRTFYPRNSFRVFEVGSYLEKIYREEKKNRVFKEISFTWQRAVIKPSCRYIRFNQVADTRSIQVYLGVLGYQERFLGHIIQLQYLPYGGDNVQDRFLSIRHSLATLEESPTKEQAFKKLLESLTYSFLNTTGLTYVQTVNQNISYFSEEVKSILHNGLEIVHPIDPR